MTSNKGLQNPIGRLQKILRSRMLDIKVDVADDHTWEVAETNDEHSSLSETARHNVEGNQSPGMSLIEEV